ncbi:MAG: hypothetical protein RL318_1199 [Fibrobacterota bacterium]|jgi:glycosyltransferase involved in cell wall biosynthesis
MSIHPFRTRLGQEMENLLLRAASLIPRDERLRIDLHCHDINSDVPDELLGRILGVRETWLPTEDLLATLKGNKVDVLTVTNHNNARSCWDLLDKGVDVLPAAEWSCHMPDMGTSFHVLAYGFTPAQEVRLGNLRRDIYRFAEYCAQEDIPTVLAHPLHFHAPLGTPPQSMMDRLGLLFQRFECVNGQRDTWQNLLTATWVEGMNEEAIHAMSRRCGLPFDGFCQDPLVKRLTGGSDDHFGMFAGSTGTILHVPELKTRLARGESRTQLALEALRRNATAPYGTPCEEEKLAGALLDYACQLVLHMEDPGMLRVLLHRGEPSDKVMALAIANGVFELRRHKVTMELLRTIHRALHGHDPSLKVRLFTSKTFRPLVGRLRDVARARRESPQALQRALKETLPAVFHDLGDVLATRVRSKFDGKKPSISVKDISKSLEIPTHFRTLFGSEPTSSRKVSNLHVGEIVDGLPFPLLSAGVLGGAVFAAHAVLNDARPFMDEFAKTLGRFEHPKRILWMTDTMGDRNGVSHALESVLEEIRKRDLPIDILTCSSTLEEGPHLRVVRPVAEFAPPFYEGQSLRVPDAIALHRLFLEGGYDRILSSTEGPMGWCALLLKNAFHVPTHFFLHTDWLDFGRRRLNLEEDALDRLRRGLRAWYKAHDSVFVLNREQSDWLLSPDIGLSPDAVHSTAHWAEEGFAPSASKREELFPGVQATDPVLLFAGRLSEEKGVLDLGAVLAKVRETHPTTRLVLCGTGPAEETLRRSLPDAIFLGWTAKETLAKVYAAADFLVLPSRFDTFGCVVLEAMACGLPVLAYDSKGPRDLVEHGISGFLGSRPEDLGFHASQMLGDSQRLQALRHGALRRAGDYRATDILDQLMKDMGLGDALTESVSGKPVGASLWGELLEIVTG